MRVYSGQCRRFLSRASLTRRCLPVFAHERLILSTSGSTRRSEFFQEKGRRGTLKDKHRSMPTDRVRCSAII